MLYLETGNRSFSIGHPELQAEHDTFPPASPSAIRSSIRLLNNLKWIGTLIFRKCFLHLPQFVHSPRQITTPCTLDEPNDYPIALGPKPHPAKDTSSLILDNLRQRSTQALELNTRLTQNQAHEHGIALPPVSSYGAYTPSSVVFQRL